MAPRLPPHVDTVIIGGGPSSLILSYILHGHVPYYVGRHHDAILHQKLSRQPDLLHATPDLYAHFYSSLRYSTQALPVNILLDTLIRPNVDTVIDSQACVEWRTDPDKAISHAVITEADRPGGQWTQNTVPAVADIGTLSYSEMLSLPGYSYSQHHEKRHGQPAPTFERPTRSQTSAYFAAYPSAVGIQDTLHVCITVSTVSRTAAGFRLQLSDCRNISCTHLVLATGIFAEPCPPPPLLQPLSTLPLSNPTANHASTPDPDIPLLVIGTGFTAADTILSQPPAQKIVHLFRWDPDNRPSPLRACHAQAYPEYAGVYRWMKAAASGGAGGGAAVRKGMANPGFAKRDWARVYEGFANAEVCGVKIEEGGGRGTVRVRLRSGAEIERAVGGLVYAGGRRGSLAYLDPGLLNEVLGDGSLSGRWITGRVLRPKAEVDLELARDVFVIGSLTGDSLVRHAYGGCVHAAGRIMGAKGEVTHPMRRGVVWNGKVFAQERSKGLENGLALQDLHFDGRKVVKEGRAMLRSG